MRRASGALEAALRRDRIVVAASLAALAALAWLYLFQLSADMSGMMPPERPQAEPMDGMAAMPGMAMDAPAGDAFSMARPSLVGTYWLTATMWFVMMVGMMLPGAAPTILVFAAVERKGESGAPIGRTGLFVAGYLLTWGAFALAAAAAQIALAATGIINAELATPSMLVGGGVFILAGLYELTPLKEKCLSHCRSPLEWLSRHHRPGPRGALAMGLEHGMYCIGCCWMLMVLLFVAGVMNLLFVALLAAIVLAQKLLPGGRAVTRIAALALVACGIGLMSQPWIAAQL